VALLDQVMRAAASGSAPTIGQRASSNVLVDDTRPSNGRSNAMYDNVMSSGGDLPALPADVLSRSVKTGTPLFD